MTSTHDQARKLAIDGGEPIKQKANPPMYPGGMAVDSEEEAAVLEVLRAKRLFRFYGPGETPSKVAALEEAFAEKMGVRHALAVTSGTAALTCALHALGVGPGDEVIVPGYTWIASAAAVVTAGAIPIIAEVDASLLLDPQDVEAKISPYTRAIMPVHMRGAPCRMDELLAVARKHDLAVIEDTAQADGASYFGKRLGSLGDVGCYSLQFNKIITAGEGGMVTTNREDLWQRSLMYHDVIAPMRYGVPEADYVTGTNYRMPEMLGAVALVQLQRLDGLLEAMRTRKRLLKAGMADVARRKGIEFREIVDPEGEAGIALIFFVENGEQAQRIADALAAENIGAARIFQPDAPRLNYHVYANWLPILEKRTWSSQGGPWRDARRPIEYHAEMCPRTTDLLTRAVHLDVSPLLDNEDVEETIEGLNVVLDALA